MIKVETVGYVRTALEREVTPSRPMPEAAARAVARPIASCGADVPLLPAAGLHQGPHGEVSLPRAQLENQTMEDYYVETFEGSSIFKSPDYGYYWQAFVWFETIEECRADIAAWNRRFETV